MGPPLPDLDQTGFPGETDALMNTDGPGPRPLPAGARSKTLPRSGRGNGFELVKQVVALIGDGANHDDLVSLLVAGPPPWNERSAKHCLGGIKAGLRVFDRNGARVRLTDSGRALRQTGDPDSLREWMLTGLLGFDHLLVWMAAAPRPKRWLLDELRQVNRGWTTDTFPNALINWTLWLNLSVKTVAGFTITERGRRWRSAIYWTPEPLT